MKKYEVVCKNGKTNVHNSTSDIIDYVGSDLFLTGLWDGENPLNGEMLLKSRKVISQSLRNYISGTDQEFPDCSPHRVIEK